MAGLFVLGSVDWYLEASGFEMGKVPAQPRQLLNLKVGPRAEGGLGRQSLRGFGERAYCPCQMNALDHHHHNHNHNHSIVPS